MSRRSELREAWARYYAELHRRQEAFDREMAAYERECDRVREAWSQGHYLWWPTHPFYPSLPIPPAWPDPDARHPAEEATP